MQVHTVTAIPDDLSRQDQAIYHLPASHRDDEWYAKRTDRNIGWITEEEQKMLRGATVGLASVGGIGGAVSMMLHRSGIGHLKLADLDNFDISNLNRQFGATKGTVGTPKIKAITQELRTIGEDIDLTLYPMGITEESVDHFLEGCDIVLDGIDFWAIGARVLLQMKAREKGIPVLNCSTVGYGSRIFLFDPKGKSIEQCLGLSYAEAKEYERKAHEGILTKPERVRLTSAIAIGLLPELPSYSKNTEPAGNIQAIRKVVMEKGSAPGMSASCWLACSFVANHIVMYLLKDSGVKRHIQLPPAAPGYLYLDVGFMKAKACKGGLFNRLKRQLSMKVINCIAGRMEKHT